MYFARKFSRAKWWPKDGVADDEIPADAVTADLRTTMNKLSVWRCERGPDNEILEQGLLDAALALATAGDRIDRLDIVWFACEEVERSQLVCQDSDGRTPVAALVRRHVDICELDYHRLGKVATVVQASIEQGLCKRLTEKRVTQLIADAVQNERVELDALPPRIQDGVRKLLGA